MKHLLILLLGMSVVCAAPEKPNIIFILADDYGMPGVVGAVPLGVPGAGDGAGGMEPGPGAGGVKGSGVGTGAGAALAGIFSF